MWFRRKTPIRRKPAEGAGAGIKYSIRNQKLYQSLPALQSAANLQRHLSYWLWHQLGRPLVISPGATLAIPAICDINMAILGSMTEATGGAACY